MNYQQRPKRNDCPNCGKPEGAIMTSSSWSHSVSCCSDACGLEILKKIRKNTTTKEYKAVVKTFYETQDRMYELKYTGIPNCGEAIHYDKMY